MAISISLQKGCPLIEATWTLTGFSVLMERGNRSGEKWDMIQCLLHSVPQRQRVLKKKNISIFWSFCFAPHTLHIRSQKSQVESSVPILSICYKRGWAYAFCWLGSSAPQWKPSWPGLLEIPEPSHWGLANSRVFFHPLFCIHRLLFLIQSGCW